MKFCQYILLSLIALCGCTDASTNPPTDGITIIHLNDTYRVDAVEEGRNGGFARVSTVVKQLQREGRTVLLTHGGDFLFPSLESQLWEGRQMVEAMNFLDAVAPMYVAPGNHEFDSRRPGAAVNALRDSTFDWVVDNMTMATGDPQIDKLLLPAHVVEIGGLRVGFFGLTLLPDDGGNVRDYAPLDGDYVPTAEQAIRNLEEQGADIIVGLTHLHLADDKDVATLRENHPSFVLLAGGHEHEPEFEPITDTHAMVAKGASNARVIWRIDITGSETQQVSAEQIVIDDSIAEDPEYLPISDKWRARLLEKIPFLPSVIGHAAVPLDAREVTIRNEESNWGNFIADQMLGAFGEPADLAFINSGTLRIDDYIADDITFEDIGRTFGFSSYLRRMTISGADFITLLEAGYRGEGPSKGYFPQVAGFRVCVDRTRPDGQRIVQLQLPTDDGWQPIDEAADYSLIGADYLFGGGDGYDFSAAREPSPPGSELKYLVLDAVIRAQAEGQKIGALVDPDNPRIAFAAGGQCYD